MVLNRFSDAARIERIDMKPFAQRFGAFLAAALLVGAACPVVAARSTAHPPTDALSQGNEIAEQLSENAPSIDAAAFNKAMSDINELDARLAKALSPDRKKALDALVTSLGGAWTIGDRSAVGVQAIDVQVAQLDYVGFKVNALLSASSVNWAQVSETVREASTWWSAIEPHTSDATLREAMNRTLLGMKEATDQKDAKVMHFAADMELILVDGLETFFTAHPRSH
jgi:hypothetical protein